MNKVLAVLIALVAVVMVIGATFVLFERIAEEQKEEPIAVTITGTERVELRFGGGLFAADRVESMPYIIAKTENGETIVGVIDIATLIEGDKVVIMENTPHDLQEFKGHKWYKFVGYQ